MRAAVVLAILNALAVSQPNQSLQLHYLEGLLYENTELSFLTVNCSARASTSVAAQWIRIAYHDMATYNVEDGTGGLDASIRFELDRPENIGIGMRNSINDFRSHTRPFASMADIIAMGTVFAYPSCGGPLIPFRAGRVDATFAGVPGVPEPHQDLDSHIASFKRQGFTQTEMIQLVACGHAVGGVRKEDFPEVTNDTFALFHGEQTYDNTVVTGYLDSTTPNALVVSNNVTVRSDFRIFESDGNVTMESLTSQNAFDETCAVLIERMINTVPKNVTLTEAIQPIENKIGKTRLFLSNDTDNLTLTTSLRLLNPTLNPDRTVTLFWTDSNNSILSVCPTGGCSAQPFDTFSIGDRGGFLGGNGFALHGMDAMKFEFEVSVNSTTSISNYWFEIDENDGISEKVVVDGISSAYPILHDKVLFDPIRSFTTFENSSTVRFVTIAVRSEFQPTRLYLETFDPNQSGRDLELPVTQVIDVPLDTNIPPKAGYTFYTVKVVGSVVSFDIYAEFGDEYLSQDSGLPTQLDYSGASREREREKENAERMPYFVVFTRSSLICSAQKLRSIFFPL